MKEFKVGDKVWSPVNGNGEVLPFILSKHTNPPYPIRVKFQKFPEHTVTYTVDGKFDKDNPAPTLFHGHDLILEAREPKRVWVNLYWDKVTAEGWTGAPHSSEALAIQLIQDSDGSIYLKTIELTIPE